VKESVFPFIKFPHVDPILGPEMKSTGEVMGIGGTFGEAFAKALSAAGTTLPRGGTALISVRDADKRRAIGIAKQLSDLGYALVATRGTAQAISDAGIRCRSVNKVIEGRPHIVDMIKNDEIALIVNTTEGRQAIADSYTIRRNALQRKVTYATTLSGAEATCEALRLLDEPMVVHRLQSLHHELASS
jgi:carbamoyl-phosphate synthase large subunit